MNRGRVTVVLLAVLVGCGPVGSPVPITFHSDTLPNGTVQVENTGESAWPVEDRWEAQEVIRIGTLDGEGPDQFGRVSGLAVGEDGTIFVGGTIFQPDPGLSERRLFFPCLWD